MCVSDSAHLKRAHTRLNHCRSIHPAMDGVGFLFMTGGGHAQVADGDTVKLGNREWRARHTTEGLELTIEHVENNGPQQVRGRHADIKNELDHRKQEVQALRAQRAELETEMEQVVART